MVLFKGYVTGGSVTTSSVSIASQACLTDNNDILLADIRSNRQYTCFIH